jgi:membrane-associated phospholipid phosphatase
MKLKPMSMGLLAMVGLVSPSRFYEGHHWPTDLAVSHLLGTTYVIGLTALYRRVRARDRGAER